MSVGVLVGIGSRPTKGRAPLAAQIARKIRRERLHTVNASDIRRRWRLPGLTSVEDVKEAIEVLCETGWLTPSGSRAGETQERQSSDYRVNPAVFEAR